MITLELQDDYLVASGTYSEMSPHIPTLKRSGFRYDGTDRTWYIQASKISPDALEKLRKKLGLPEPAPTASTEQQQEVVSYVRTLTRQSNPTYRVDLLPYNGAPQSVVVAVYTPEGVRLVTRAGGKYNQVAGGYIIPLASLTERELKKLLDGVEKAHVDATEATERLRKQVEDVLPPGRWSALGVSAYLNGARLYVTGSTLPYRERLRDAGLTWDATNRRWDASVLDVRVSVLRALVAQLGQDEQAKANQPPPPPEAPRRFPNRKPGPCERCGGTVAPGEGWMWRGYDDDEDKEVWIVRHRDEAVCERVLAQRRERQQLLTSKRAARRALADYATQHGVYESGNHILRGDEIPIEGSNLTPYGGGVWVVVEPGHSHAWYVVNNGADGDNWAHNNVQTGGAGAIGRRMPYTPELEALISAARE